MKQVSIVIFLCVLFVNAFSQDLFKAIQEDDMIKIKSILNKNNINTYDKNGHTPLIIAIKNKKIALLDLLLKRKADINKMSSDSISPVEFAVNTGNSLILEKLIAHGANPNSIGKYDFTTLMYAAYEGHFDIVKLLVEKYNANVNATNKYGWTPLIFSCRKGDIQLTEYLINNGAEVNTVTKDGKSVLIYAIMSCSEYKNNIGLIRLLINKGAKTDFTDYNGTNVLMFAAQYGNLDVLRYFIETIEININKVDNNGLSVIDYVSTKPMQQYLYAIMGKIDILEFITTIKNHDYTAFNEKIKHVPNLNMPIGFQEYTALIYACIEGNKDMVNDLIEYGADVNIQDKRGMTALMHAVFWSYDLDLIKTLIKHGADISITDINGQKAIDLARYTDVINYLKSL